MSGFQADWLRLREPCDTRSRSEPLVHLLRKRLPNRPLRALDLGTGTAANIRYLAPRLGGTQYWLAIDNDASLIAQQPSVLQGPGYDCRLSPRQLDLASGLDALPLADHPLVTASALLDLVSGPWLQTLAERCRGAGSSVLFALTYDGRLQCWPPEPDDDWLRRQINLHQHRDKGFGPALGPQAAQQADTIFRSLGFETRLEPSDWLIEPQESALQTELVEGWTKAAREIAPLEWLRIEAWSRRRKEHVGAGISRFRVGHQDFTAWPTTAGG